MGWIFCYFKYPNWALGALPKLYDRNDNGAGGRVLNCCRLYKKGISMDIIRGRVYRAKRPVAASYGLADDRRVTFATSLQVGYTAPSGGAKTVSREDFEKWAARDVTNEVPLGDWAPYTRGMK